MPLESVSEGASPERPVVVAAADPHLRTVLEAALATATFTPVMARDAGDAWQSLFTVRGVALVIADQPSRLDGFALARSVRAHPDLPCLPIVVFAECAHYDTRWEVGMGDVHLVDRSAGVPALVGVLRAVTQTLRAGRCSGELDQQATGHHRVVEWSVRSCELPDTWVPPYG
jgi:DNA-binding response OmpR family regulator